MDPLKEAFSKIKQDILDLQLEINALRLELKNCNSPNIPLFPTHQHLSSSPISQQTDKQTTPTNNPTQNMPLEALKDSNYASSIGNRGVPTDKQTHQQTHQQTEKTPPNTQITSLKPSVNTTTFDEADETLRALNTLKNEIRGKFKALTPQEMIVFSTIYSFQDQDREITYKTLADHLKLSESSIRDYTNRLIKKDIPIIKEKVNNKLVLLSIASSLRKNLSLSSIISLIGLQ